ncbi:MAG: Mut7-C RNAse domain-containing protein, partial [Nitrososphaeria archaeon]
MNNEKHYYNEENIKFITDSMLGNIARKLRLFGFDVLYYKKGDDEGLL